MLGIERRCPGHSYSLRVSGREIMDMGFGFPKSGREVIGTETNETSCSIVERPPANELFLGDQRAERADVEYRYRGTRIILLHRSL